MRVLRSWAIPATLIALAPAIPGSAGAGKWEAIEKLPDQTPVVVLVEKQPRTYFRLTPEKPLTIAVEGPVRLRVISRLELPRGAKQPVSYTLRVTEADRELDRQQTESSASSKVRDPDGHRTIAKSRRLHVDVPAGHHVVALSVEGTPAVLVRLHQAAPGTGEEPTVALTPIEAPRTVSVVEGEKTIPCFSALPGRPVKLRVVGPTSLDLITRLDYDATMRGTQTYRLGVFDRGKRIRVLELRTAKSATAIYSELPDRSPSRPDRTRLAIGDGVHEIAVELLAPSRGAAEIHARIPQPVVGRQE